MSDAVAAAFEEVNRRTRRCGQGEVKWKSIGDLIGRDQSECETVLLHYGEKFRTIIAASCDDSGISKNSAAAAKVAAVEAFAFAAAAIASLQARVDALEEGAASLAYKGVWQRAQAYEKGHAVTHGGSLWIALRDTDDEPTTDAQAWQLAVKRGRDGRDAR